jgi:hypothetical protein
MKTSQILKLLCVFLILMIISNSFADVFVPSPVCLPPPGNNAYLQEMHTQYGPVELSNATHKNFLSCFFVLNISQIGDSAFHTFGSTVTGIIKISNPPPNPPTIFTILVPADVTVKLVLDSIGISPNGSQVRYFSTEMIQLEIVGGNLPPCAHIRESPTEYSLGLTTVTETTGGYIVDSFFDIYTELSLDCGQSWIPGDVPAHMVLQHYEEPQISVVAINYNTVTVVTSSGTATPLFYSWSNGATTQTITGLSTGTYSVSVIFNDGSLLYGSVIITGTVPTLSEWGLIIFGSLLLITGVVFVWRRYA